MLNHQIARLRLLGTLFCLLGGAAITVGWAGTAQVACVDCQVPYLLSGGAAGVALIIIGMGLLVIAQLRVEGDRIVEQIATLTGDPAASTADTAPLAPVADEQGTGGSPAPADRSQAPR